MLKILFVFSTFLFIDFPLIPIILLLGIIGFMVETSWIAFMISIVILLLTLISFGALGYMTILAYIISVLDALNIRKFLV